MREYDGRGYLIRQAAEDGNIQWSVDDDGIIRKKITLMGERSTIETWDPFGDRWIYQCDHPNGEREIRSIEGFTIAESKPPEDEPILYRPSP